MLVGLPFLALARRVFARDAAAAAWPRVPGVILESGLSSRRQTVRSQSGASYEHTSYTPLVRYAYTVGSETLEGRSIAHGADGVWMGQAAARRYVDKYPVEARVEVIHDPSDPKKAHLEVKTRSIGAIILFGFGSIWVGIGSLLILLGVAAALIGCGPSTTGRACDPTDPCPTHFACVNAHDGVTRCMRECDFSETVCQDGTICLPLGGATGGACYLGGNTPVGGTCTTDLDCTRDAICLRGSVRAECRIGCNLDGTHPCAGGFYCLPAGGSSGYCGQTM